MPEQDADLFEVLVGQMWKRRDIDPVLGEALSVLGHAGLSSQSATCCIEAVPPD
jgi:hypothetical protein